MKYTPNLSRSELKTGFIAMAVCLLVLPSIVGLALPGESAARLLQEAAAALLSRLEDFDTRLRRR